MIMKSASASISIRLSTSRCRTPPCPRQYSATIATSKLHVRPGEQRPADDSRVTGAPGRSPSAGLRSLSTRRRNRRVPITEVDQFLAEVLPRQIEAEKAICNGDPAPRLAMWSSKNPVTLFGADATKQGAQEVRRFFPLLASWFANSTAYRFELVAAGAVGSGLHRRLRARLGVLSGRPGGADQRPRHARLPARER